MPGAAWNRGLVTGPKRPIEYYLRKGVITSTSRLRNRILKAGLLKNICTKCGLGPEWCSKPLTLQLDHINGDRTDNRLKNLRIICPNCHTQTKTYARQKGNKLN
jgi:hypothetical protein